MKYLILMIAAICICNGCTASHELHRVGGGSAPTLDRGEAVFIATPADGAYGGRLYTGSGRSAAGSLAEAFSRHAANVAQSPTADLDVNTACAEAAEGGFTYLGFPTILHWEDRATEWSGKRDHVSVRIDLYTVRDGEQIDAAVINGRSKWATFGGDHPQDLLRSPMRTYVDSLYQ